MPKKGTTLTLSAHEKSCFLNGVRDGLEDSDEVDLIYRSIEEKYQISDSATLSASERGLTIHTCISAVCGIEDDLGRGCHRDPMIRPTVNAFLSILKKLSVDDPDLMGWLRWHGVKRPEVGGRPPASAAWRRRSRRQGAGQRRSRLSVHGLSQQQAAPAVSPTK